MSNDEFDPVQDRINNMKYALSCRRDLIQKYDSGIKEKDNQNEIKWISHVENKLEKGWIPDYGEVSLEVNKTLELGLRLRRNNLKKGHPQVIGIEHSKESEVIHVNFKKNID